LVETYSLRAAMDTVRFVWQGGMPMMRHFISRGIVLGALVVSTTGCETFHSMVRHKDNDEVTAKEDTDDTGKAEAVDSDVSKLKSVDSTGKNNQPFFNPTRARSAFTSFSPEAQEIEKNLGVY
jgi:hypothetical protein